MTPRAESRYHSAVRSVFNLLWVALALSSVAVAAPSQISLLTPPPSDGPLVVRVGFQLLDINSIDEQTETFEFSGVLSVQWKDPRQAFDSATEGVEEKFYQGNFQFNEISPSWYPEISLLNAAGTFDKGEALFRVLPDGTSTLVTPVNAVAKTPFFLRHYPFDRQQLRLSFGIPGYTDKELTLEPLPVPALEMKAIHVPQWTLSGVEAASGSIIPTLPDSGVGTPVFNVALDVKRQPLFVLRLVVGPLFLVVVLSWSVFWMDRASVGDRMSVSFVGLLTAVAYQIVLGEILPHVAYLTPVNVFVNLSFMLMCASIVVNLVVGELNRSGRGDQADVLDNRCKVLFPVVYLSLIAIVSILFAVRF